MAVDPDAVARRLATLFKSDFNDGKTKGKFIISKADLRLLADGTPFLKTTTLTRVIQATLDGHSLVLFPLDGTVDKARNFGVMKTGPVWRTVPDKLVKSVART